MKQNIDREVIYPAFDEEGNEVELTCPTVDEEGNLTVFYFKEKYPKSEDTIEVCYPQECGCPEEGWRIGASAYLKLDKREIQEFKQDWLRYHKSWDWKLDEPEKEINTAIAGAVVRAIGDYLDYELEELALNPTK